MEILNQYMHNWKGFHASYTLNVMYYYIYQSFLLCPPIAAAGGGSNNNYSNNRMEEQKLAQPNHNRNDNRATTMEDGDFKKVLLISKIQDKIDKMGKIVQKLSVANVTMSQNSDIIAFYTDSICTKNAMIESEIESMENNSEKIETFIDNNEGKEINDIDEFVKPEDEVSEYILDFLADETACEETIEVVRSRFRKKKISLEEYLDAVRTLSNQQFMSMAKRRKIMSVVSAHNR